MFMKTPLLFILIFLSFVASAQITSPVVRAYFGVDGDLKARSVNGALQSSDDWFLQPGTGGTSSNGTFVIDTTGAASILSGYAIPANRLKSFYRSMSKPAFTVVNNRLWLDALMVRDYHGSDSTAFIAGSDKNGMSPANWSGGTQGIPDKNDILDMFMHVRRAGPSTTDSLWFFGGLSLDNITGNRYFDFELYQTDIYYDRLSAKWFGYGPDEGHTSWEFSSTGAVTKPGDIIFSAEYQSSSLTKIEARIWVHKNALLTAPTTFDWAGQFDGNGAGAQYGYASILPKNGGTFYTGLQCGVSEWAGAFSLVLQDNSLVTSYSGKQFMEFSVNLSKLGLDPVLLFGTDICGTPFNRMVVKTRASASFTAELKDFVAPTDLFLAPRANAVATVPLFCGNPYNVSSLEVLNPSTSSVYTWSTPNGNIVGDTVTTSATADRDGMYIVTQQLMQGCGAYARDTVYITHDADCMVLAGREVDLKVSLYNNFPRINWIDGANSNAISYGIERSYDGANFHSITTVANKDIEAQRSVYSYIDEGAEGKDTIYYRIQCITKSGSGYSRTASIITHLKKYSSLSPNPATNYIKISVPSERQAQANVIAYNLSGKVVFKSNVALKQGNNQIVINEISGWAPGVYLFHITNNGKHQWHKVLIHSL